MSNKLLHTKVSKRKPLDKFPSNEDGHDGDMQIVSIKGKGTYLCLKDNGEWKISDKFNTKNKFDTHVFDQITTRKIKGPGGLAASIIGESVSTNTYSGKTASSSTNIQSIFKIGDGSNPGVLSSNQNQDLTLKTGNSTSSLINITDGANGGILSAMNGTAPFDIVWNSTSATSGEFALLNIGANANSGCHLNLQVSNGSADAYVKYAYLADDPNNNKQWITGMDGSDSDKFKINYIQSGTDITPSSGTNLLSITATGALTLGDGTDGTDRTLTFSTSTAPFTIGVDDSQDKFCIDSGATLTGTSDFEMDASGNVTIAGDLAVNGDDITCDGTLTIDAATDLILDANSGIFKFYLAGDTDDLCTLTVAANGATTIATADSDGAVGHLTLDIDGDITLDAFGAQINIDKGGTTFGYFDTATVGKLKLIGTTNYNIEINSLGTGDITLASADDITIDAADALTIDTDGSFLMRQDGTEYSVAKSAYAGMILGYRMIGEDGAHDTYTLTTSYVVPDAAMTVRFIAPPSGAVEVMVQVFFDGASNRVCNFGLSDNATYNSLGDSYEQATGQVDESDTHVHQHYWTITGLTAGSTYNYWFGASANGGTLNWGGTGADRYCDFIMKVTALPTATADFAVYG